VNNTKYPNFVLDAINPQAREKLRELRIEYHREVLPGEKLSILIRRDGEALLARGENSMEQLNIFSPAEFYIE